MKHQTDIASYQEDRAASSDNLGWNRPWLRDIRAQRAAAV
jgi:hypothetical protein